MDSEKNFINDIVQKERSWMYAAKLNKINLTRATDLIIENGLADAVLDKEMDMFLKVESLFNSGYTIREISAALKTSKYRATSLLRMSGYEVERYYHKGRADKIDHNYFDEINSEDKAYFLGLMYADGYNSYDTNKYQIELTLQSRDVHILDTFRESMKSTYEVKDKKVKNKSTGLSTTYKSFSFYSKTLSNSLRNLGCTQSKTYTLTFPGEDKVPSSLVNHFIRGYMDGDGSISAKGIGKQNTVSFQGTEEFLDGLQNVLVEKAGVRRTKIMRGNGNVFELKKGGRHEAIKALDWIYQDSTVFIKRKHREYLKMKSL